MVLGAFPVSVPIRVVELDEAHSPFHHPAGQKAHATKFCVGFPVQAIGFTCGLGFFGNIDQFGRGSLHAEGQFIVGKLSGQAGVVGSFGQVLSVPLIDLIEDEPLVRRVKWRVEVFNGGAFRAKECSLIDRR